MLDIQKRVHTHGRGKQRLAQTGEPSEHSRGQLVAPLGSLTMETEYQEREVRTACYTEAAN